MSFYFRQFAWYSPELNVIVLQTIAEDCIIAFEWDNEDLIKRSRFSEVDPIDQTEWVPLGEL